MKLSLAQSILVWMIASSNFFFASAAVTFCFLYHLFFFGSLTLIRILLSLRILWRRCCFKFIRLVFSFGQVAHLLHFITLYHITLTLYSTTAGHRPSAISSDVRVCFCINKFFYHFQFPPHCNNHPDVLKDIFYQVSDAVGDLYMHRCYECHVKCSSAPVLSSLQKGP